VGRAVIGMQAGQRRTKNCAGSAMRSKAPLRETELTMQQDCEAP